MEAILKKSSLLILSQGLARVIGFLYTIFLAKNLAVDEFGLYATALAYFSLVSIFSDFGFNRFLIREVSINKERLPQVLFNITILRLTFSAILFFSFSIGLYVFDPDRIRGSLSTLAILAVLPQTIAASIDGVFIALQKLKFSSISTLILGITNVTVGVFLVNLKYGPLGVVAALIFAHIVYLLFLFYCLKKENLKIFSPPTPSVLKKVLSGSLAYGLLGIMGLIYFKIDTLLLSYIRGNFETGLYSVSYKFLEAVILVPSAISAVIFPALAKLHQRPLPQLKKYYFNSLKLMGILGVLVFSCYLLVLPVIINVLLPKYIPVIPIIQLLSFTIPFMLIHTPSTQLLLSSEKYIKPVMLFSLLTMVFNVVSNLIFIPIYGYLAAAWITVLSEALSFIIFFIFIQRRVFVVK